MANVLIVDDDMEIRKMISMHLKFANYGIFEAEDSHEAQTITNNNNIDLVLLDVMLPGENGFSLSQYFIKKEIPTIFISAKTEICDRVHGLQLGADDYIVKPFEPAELLARIDVVLRRVGKLKDKFTDNNIIMDFKARSLECSGKIIDLTPTEFELMAILVRNKNIALSREALLQAIWNCDFTGESRTVDVHVQRLRKKVKDGLIETVYKYGYKYTGGKTKWKKD